VIRPGGVNRTRSHRFARYQVSTDLGDSPHMTPQNPDKVRAAALREMLATQRDQHARQRELVRASLTLCPGKTRPRPVR
jgi:hypothetical protein